MNKLFANVWLLIGVAAVFVVGSVLASYCTGKWHWFGRSGAIVTMAGVILNMRPLVRMGFAEWLRSQNIIDGGDFVTAEEVEKDRQGTIDAFAVKIGLYMVVIGTVVWAYGELIGGLP